MVMARSLLIAYVIILKLEEAIAKSDRTKEKKCCPSPACALCDAPAEDARHYFLYCLSFVALCEKLFASVVQLLGNR